MSTKRLYILKQTYPHHWRWVGLFVDFFVGYTDEEKDVEKTMTFLMMMLFFVSLEPQNWVTTELKHKSGFGVVLCVSHI